ncbi:MAG: hypothetical protein PHE79_04665 [Eubacteriales bacterium]|jgi:hypothetical protein|nr:hypothetical protein [Eubacteriales bacterium]
MKKTKNNMNNSTCNTNEKVESNNKRFDSRMSQGDMKEVNQGDIRSINNSRIKEQIRPNSDY